MLLQPQRKFVLANGILPFSVLTVILPLSDTFKLSPNKSFKSFVFLPVNSTSLLLNKAIQ